jgi:hypothetical protein
VVLFGEQCRLPLSSGTRSLIAWPHAGPVRINDAAQDLQRLAPITAPSQVSIDKKWRKTSVGPSALT